MGFFNCCSLVGHSGLGAFDFGTSSVAGALGSGAFGDFIGGGFGAS